MVWKRLNTLQTSGRLTRKAKIGITAVTTGGLAASETVECPAHAVYLLAEAILNQPETGVKSIFESLGRISAGLASQHKPEMPLLKMEGLLTV